MTEKFLYVVDHYIPFPSSEYGGLWNVVAQNDEECFDLITEKDKGDYNGWFCPCHGSHYDVSGRIRKGPAPKNMEIPKFEFVDNNTIKIG